MMMWLVAITVLLYRVHNCCTSMGFNPLLKPLKTQKLNYSQKLAQNLTVKHVKGNQQVRIYSLKYRLVTLRLKTVLSSNKVF